MIIEAAFVRLVSSAEYSVHAMLTIIDDGIEVASSHSKSGLLFDLSAMKGAAVRTRVLLLRRHGRPGATIACSAKDGLTALYSFTLKPLFHHRQKLWIGNLERTNMAIIKRVLNTGISFIR